MPVMIRQKGGQIYNVEGHGSNDAKILGLSMYGTSKRAVTYFTEALAYEAEKLDTNVLVGKITPGIMITNFIHTALGDGEKIELDEKTKLLLNSKLQILIDSINNNPEVTFTYFIKDKNKEGGKYINITGNIKKIDTNKNLVILTNKIVIPITDIINITSKLFNSSE